MVINIDETNCTYFENSILQDIATYKNLPNWLTAIKNEEVNFYPADCSIKINNEWFQIVCACELSADIDKVINKVKKLPTEYRDFPNDNTEIHADSFEHELSFNTNFAI